MRALTRQPSTGRVPEWWRPRAEEQHAGVRHLGWEPGGCRSNPTRATRRVRCAKRLLASVRDGERLQLQSPFTTAHERTPSGRLTVSATLANDGRSADRGGPTEGIHAQAHGLP